MFKAILTFIKAHIVATSITATVVVSTAIAIPIVVKNYKLDKSIKENLYMLVSSDLQSNKDIKLENGDQNAVNKEQSNNIPTNSKDEKLTFTIKRIESNVDGGTGIEYKIIPSYDKDYSKWTNAEKEAYQEAFNEAIQLSEKEHKEIIAREYQNLAEIEQNLQLEINSWSKEYICGVGNIYYNSYTKKYKGSYLSEIVRTTDPNDSSVTNYSYNTIDIDNISKEDFRNNIYPIMMQKFEEQQEQWLPDEIKEYKSNLETVYHLSD